MVDLDLIGEGAGLYARLPNIFFGQFYLSNSESPWSLTQKLVMAVRPPLGGSDAYTFISLLVPIGAHFPYGFTVEPDV